MDENGELAEAEVCNKIFSKLDTGEDINSSGEMKNRLSWAVFKTVPDKDAAKMTPDEYKQYQQQWQKVRDMKASDYRELLKPENADKLKEFEKSSLMTVKQIVEFIDIIESSTGKDYDLDDWSVSALDFCSDVLPKVNGTFNDDKILEGKTRSDIPEDRQELLKYLEEHDMLLDQFKE